MADFNSFISQIEDKFEGGYQNIPTDNGNWTGGVKNKGTLVGTNHGIAASTLSQWLGRTATISDMKNLSKEDAKQIFKSLFWDKMNADKINSQGIAEFLFDWSLGSAYSFKEINKALNHLYGTNFPESGIQNLENQQINVINSASDQNKLLDTLKDYRLNWYNNIVKEDNSQAKFLPSWTNRTMSMFDKWYGKFGETVASATKGVEETSSSIAKTIKRNPIPTAIITSLVLISIYAILKSLNKK